MATSGSLCINMLLNDVEECVILLLKSKKKEVLYNKCINCNGNCKLNFVLFLHKVVHCINFISRTANGL